jgi:hypothetical protein
MRAGISVSSKDRNIPKSMRTGLFGRQNTLTVYNKKLT